MPMTMKVDIDTILENPWQPRENMDESKVRELAESISDVGLLQNPVGRLYRTDDQRTAGVAGVEEFDELHNFALKKASTQVQLAFGHRRLEAFKYGRFHGLPGEWDQIPVIVQDIDDEGMFRLAAIENLERNDLNPIELARMMERYRTEFGKTSEEIGALYNLSDSSVRNKIRLLKLPEVYKNHLICGNLSEGSAREIVTLYDLDPDLRSKAEEITGISAQDVIDAALSGMAPNRVHELVQQLSIHIAEMKQPALPFVPDQVEEPLSRSEASDDGPISTTPYEPECTNEFEKRLIAYLDKKDFVSASGMQIALRISYLKAREIIDELQSRGYLASPVGSQYRVTDVPSSGRLECVMEHAGEFERKPTLDDRVEETREEIRRQADEDVASFNEIQNDEEIPPVEALAESSEDQVVDLSANSDVRVHFDIVFPPYPGKPANRMVHVTGFVSGVKKGFWMVPQSDWVMPEKMISMWNEMAEPEEEMAEG